LIRPVLDARQSWRRPSDPTPEGRSPRRLNIFPLAPCTTSEPYVRANREATRGNRYFASDPDNPEKPCGLRRLCVRVVRVAAGRAGRKGRVGRACRA
jgi:hypothetical protein